MEPSKVIHIRSIDNNIVEEDIYQFFKKFGEIKNFLLFSSKTQALIEMENISVAKLIISNANNNALLLNGRTLFLNYSISKEIDKHIQNINQKQNRFTIEHFKSYHSDQSLPIDQTNNIIDRLTNGNQTSSSLNSSTFASNILLFTIVDCLYPITTTSLYTLCSPIKPVSRIVVFRRSSSQALIEFDSIQSAEHVKNTLDNFHMYTNCNLIKIEFSKTSMLIIKKNDDYTYDYTDSTLPNYVLKPQRQKNLQPLFQKNHNSQQNQGSVLMVYGMTNIDHFNCDRLFNLFCLYGNVIKIKFLLNKQGSAMVQMEDCVGAEFCLLYLNKLIIYGCTLLISRSKAPFIAGKSMSQLSDGSPDVIDYSYSSFNRFTSRSYRKRKYQPSNVLYFSNAPIDISKENIETILKEHNVNNISSIELFPKVPGQEIKSSTGLIEFSTLNDAVETIFQCNHIIIQNKEGSEYTIKLSFSTNKQNNSITPEISNMNVSSLEQITDLSLIDHDLNFNDDSFIQNSKINYLMLWY